MSDQDTLALIILFFLVVLVSWLVTRRVGDQEHQPRRGGKEGIVAGRTAVEDFREVKVVHVIDGDTLIASTWWEDLKIRLDSIDCPEDGQPWGDTARYGLIKMIGGQYVRIEEHGRDHHGRTLATIYVKHRCESRWINVNERMVTLGHAWVMRKYYDHLPDMRKDQLDRLERWARSKKVGLWKTPNPIPPWKWRKGK